MLGLKKFCDRMGVLTNKDNSKKVDESTSNTSLSNLRYVITEKPKWKVFKKREVVPIPAYQTSLKPMKGCPCGASGPCKQKITPKGVTIHYPQKQFRENAVMFLKDPVRRAYEVFHASREYLKAAKKKTFSTFSAKKPPTKSDAGYYGGNTSPRTKIKTVKSRKFPTWRLDKISYRPLGTKIIKPRPYE